MEKNTSVIIKDYGLCEARAYVSTEPTRAVLGAAPQWQEAEGAEGVWQQLRPWPFALRLVRGVCERCASRDGRAHLKGVLLREGEEAQGVQGVREIREVPVVVVVVVA